MHIWRVMMSISISIRYEVEILLAHDDWNWGMKCKPLECRIRNIKLETYNPLDCLWWAIILVINNVFKFISVSLPCMCLSIDIDYHATMTSMNIYGNIYISIYILLHYNGFHIRMKRNGHLVLVNDWII